MYEKTIRIWPTGNGSWVAKWSKTQMTNSTTKMKAWPERVITFFLCLLCKLSAERPNEFPFWSSLLWSNMSLKRIMYIMNSVTMNICSTINAKVWYCFPIKIHSSSSVFSFDWSQQLKWVLLLGYRLFPMWNITKSIPNVTHSKTNSPYVILL